MNQSDRPIVSVCIATYNQENYIGQCIDSIIANTSGFTYEIIIGDDASTDATPEIIRKYQSNHPNTIKHIRQKENSGTCKNLLDTHKAASGVYIAHIDGDDTALPGKIERQVKYLEREKSCIACGHQVRIITDDGASTGQVFPSNPKTKNCKRDHILYGMPFAFSSLMYRNGLNLSLEKKPIFLDWYFVAALLDYGQIDCIPEILGEYRIAKGATTDNLKRARMKMLMTEMYSAKQTEWSEQRAEFNAVTTLEILADLKNGRSLSKPQLSLWLKTFTPQALPLLVTTHARRKSNARDLKR